MAINRKYTSRHSPEELVKRAEERVDRASVFLSGPGGRDVLGHLGTERMRFRCRPGVWRNFAEPVLVAEVRRRPEGGAIVEIRLGMRRLAFYMAIVFLVLAGVGLVGGLLRGRWEILGVPIAGAALIAGCVMIERPKVERLLRLSDEIFSGA